MCIIHHVKKKMHKKHVIKFKTHSRFLKSQPIENKKNLFNVIMSSAKQSPVNNVLHSDF